MAYQLIATNRIGSGPQVYLAGAQAVAHILRGVIVGSTDDAAVFSDVARTHLTVDGMVSAGGPAAVQMGEDGLLDSFQRVLVGTTGSIWGVHIALSVAGQQSQIINYGQISSNGVGMALCGQGAGATRVTNHGTITADIGIKRAGPSDSETIRLHNLGTLEGTIAAYDGLANAASDQIINRGQIIGHLRLGGGDDHFDGRGGGAVLGIIYGGAGNDTFLLGYGAEDIRGDSGTDTLDASTSQGLTLALDGSVDGAGRTEGDSFMAIEAVIGGRFGADNLYGAAGAETLTGLGGADRLEGRAGADTLLGGDGNDRLVGQAGVDNLSGGSGDDRFVFRLLAEAGDLITDFGASVGNNDAIEVAVDGFAAGMSPGALDPAQFQSRTDNLAQDADDRFIFRTTDATLWFDRNGNVSGGLTLLVDLQAGAILTAADILLV